MRTQPLSSSRSLLAIASLCGLVSACGNQVFDIGAVAGEGSSGASDSSSSGVVDAPDHQPLPLPPQRSTEDGGDEYGGFIMDPDGGHVSHECDVWSQDCPVGEKCNAWANDGGGSWNATKCFPIDPDPDDLGESCTVVDSGVSGLDSCVLRAICWNVDPETNTGVCVGYCEGSEANPTCSDPLAQCQGRDVPLCVPFCCPLEQDCGEGQGCYPINDGFGCVPDAGGEMGGLGEGCEFLNVCDPGLFCADPSVLPSCGGSIGCCASFCEVGSQWCSVLYAPMQCVPWYEEGQAPPGFEHTGACMLAQ